MEVEKILDKKYKLERQISSGLTADIYKVEEIETKKIFAAKIFKKEDLHYKDERYILKKLKDKNYDCVANLIDSGEGFLKKGESLKEKKYIILEYFEKGDLCKYIGYTNGLKKLHAKLIFKKIVEAVKLIHENKIYHRDLKTGNILFDDKFNPKICDFGFATMQKQHLSEVLGTLSYAALEIFRQDYDSEKVDIFALGILLFNLLTNSFPFKCVLNRYDNKPDFKEDYINGLYKFIIKEKYSEFWKYMSLKEKGRNFDKDFRNLFERMIAVDPSKRPDISEILKDPWLDEINKKSDKEIEDLEQEIFDELINKENLSLKKNSTEEKKKDDNNKVNAPSDGNRSCSSGEIKYFDISLKPDKFKKGSYLEYYIKIKGKILPSNYMNCLVNQIEDSKNELKGYDCKVKVNKNNKKLEFQLLLKEIDEDQIIKEINENVEEELQKLKEKEQKHEEKEEEEEDDEDAIKRYEMKKNECIIEIKLFESNNEEYLVRFMKIAGEKYYFYKNLDYLYSMAKEAL